jgi:hypothetical protein
MARLHVIELGEICGNQTACDESNVAAANGSRESVMTLVNSCNAALRVVAVAQLASP